MALLKNDIPPKKKYKGVTRTTHSGRYVYYYATRTNRKTGSRSRTKHETAREAAIAYDKMLIQEGKDPVNILKRTSNTIR